MIGDVLPRTEESEPAIGASRGKVRRAVEVFRKNRFSYLLLLPTVTFFVLLLWGPFLGGVWMSLHRWNFTGQPQWVGLENYTFLLQWDVFYTSLRATIIFAFTTFFQLGIALAAALSIRHISRDGVQNLISALFLIPYTLPPIVSGSIWLYLLNPDFGPLFGYLIEFGLLEKPIYWSTSGTSSLAVIMFVASWAFWPFMFIILFASLENIPSSHYETARVYGANRLQAFRHVTLPQMKSAILVVISIRLIWNLSKISQPLQLAGGGPGNQTSILGLLLYNFANTRQAFGQAYAVGIVLLAVSLVFTFVFIREFQRERGVSE